MDMNSTVNNGYSAVLESMFSSSLSSNIDKQLQLQLKLKPSDSLLNQGNYEQADDHFSGFDDMDFDLSVHHSGGDGDTLHSIHESEESVESFPKQDGYQVEEKIVYEEFVTSVAKEIDNAFLQTGKREISWNTHSQSKNRHEGAGEFYNLLLAASQRDFNVSQQQPFCDITVSLYQ